jgi:ABC-type uncharacterized transport system permease subunit
VEDLISTTADALALYHLLRSKKLIGAEHADIGRFRTADQFTEFMASQDAKFRGKYTEIFRDSKLEVAQLLDKTAAAWWGQGTQWCTKDQNKNQYEDYAKQGPVYVIVDRVNNTRYQLWWDQTDADEFEFKDVRNKEFNPTQLPFYHQLRLIFAPLHPHLMWQTNPSLAVQLAAVQEYSDAIQWIRNPSLQVQLAAVRQNSRAIRHIPNPEPDVQLAAVEQYGDAIRHIPNPEPDVQLAAVRQNGRAIEFIPNPTPEVQMRAVEQDGWAIGWISNPTPKVQLAAVEQNPDVIQLIPTPTPQARARARQLGKNK